MFFDGRKVEIVNSLKETKTDTIAIDKAVIFDKFVQKKKKIYAKFDFKDKNISITLKQKDGQYYFTTMRTYTPEMEIDINY